MSLKSVRGLIVICAVLGAGLSGCVSTDQSAQLAITSLRSGNGEAARVWSEELADSTYSKRLGEVEAGRVAMLSARMEDAGGWFRKAIDNAIDRQEGQPKIKLLEVADTLLASTVTDDRTREYHLPPYELNLALQYAILVQEALGKREDALVDARLATYVQDMLAEIYGADLEKAKASENEHAREVLAANEEKLTELIASTRSSWENPLLWWLTGVLFEANGENDLALQSYRKAAAIEGENSFYAADVQRMEAGEVIAKDKARIVFVAGDRFVAMRKSLKIPVLFYAGMSVDVPLYESEAYLPKRILIGTADGEAVAMTPAVNILALAARDLKEQLPGIITRNITRALTAIAAQTAANRVGGVTQLAVFATTSVLALMREADTRSWRTLPMGEQVWSAWVAPGKHNFAVMVDGQVKPMEVELKPGETKIVYFTVME